MSQEMVPNKSYTIWFTQRSGSTFLSEALTATGIAGKPGEHFLIPDNESIQTHYKSTGYQDFKNKLWERSATSNGVAAIKHAPSKGTFEGFSADLCSIGGFPVKTAFLELWEDLFPNGKHIFLTRRNKIRQAVSWWKAIQSNIWHKRAGDSHSYDSDLVKAYNPDALRHLLMEINFKEAGMQAFFSKEGITPLTIVYEDFIEHYEKTLREIIAFVGVDTNRLKIPAPPLQRLHDNVSEIWVQRFREEVQQDWDNPAW